MTKARVDPTQLQIRPLEPSDIALLAPFDCGDTDLNEFIRDDALRLQECKTVKTYLALYAPYPETPVGYLAVLSDAVVLKTNERKKLSLAHSDHPVVPALKVARVACHEAFRNAHRGLGELLMGYAAAVAMDISENAGCRLLTLDAYSTAIDFYNKLGFVPNLDVTHKKPERTSMRFDVFTTKGAPWLPRVGD